jgi:hypothetical protein
MIRLIPVFFIIFPLLLIPYFFWKDSRQKPALMMSVDDRILALEKECEIRDEAGELIHKPVWDGSAWVDNLLDSARVPRRQAPEIPTRLTPMMSMQKQALDEYEFLNVQDWTGNVVQQYGYKHLPDGRVIGHRLDVSMPEYDTFRRGSGDYGPR